MMKKLLFLTICLMLIVSVGANAQWKFVKYFPDTTSIRYWSTGINNGIAVDPAGNIWLQSYAANCDTLLPLKWPSGEIRVYTPRGVQLPFSPIQILSGKDEKGNAVTDTLSTLNAGNWGGTGYGLAVDPTTGDILSNKGGSRIWRINYKTGKGIVRIAAPLPGYASSLSTVGVDNYGEVFVAPLSPGTTVIGILNPDMTTAGSVASTTQDYCRAVAVDGTGNEVYVCYFSQQKLMHFHSDNGSLGPYAKKDSILGMAFETAVWHPTTRNLWTTSGNVTSGLPTGPYQPYRYYAIDVNTKKVVDSLAWYDPQIPMYGNDQRPRGIAFNKTGDTAYVGVFNSNVQPPSSWVEVFARAATAPPTAPSLATPSNGSSVGSNTPTLIWNPSTGAASYRIQVAIDSNFVSVILDDASLTVLQRQVGPLTNNMKYFWRVNASNTFGTSAYSTVWSFMTAPPTVPTLSTPPNGSVGVSIPPTFMWNPVSGATYYHIQVSTSPSFTPIVADKDSITVPSFAVNGLTNAVVYYWRVLAWNWVGTSQYSTTWSFTSIVASPTAPILISPVDGSVGISTNPVLTWNASSGAVSYRFQMATNPTFTSLVIDQNGITGTSYYVINALLNNTLYYWRVNATNAGGQSPYSGTWSFTTIIAAPAAPTLISPANNSSAISTSPTFGWNALAGAVSYRLQASRNQTFSSIVVDQGGITSTSYAVSGLSNNTLYYWHISAANAGGVGPFSTAWSFRTVLAVAINPASLFFGSVPIGTSKVLTSVLRYNGQDTLHVTNIVPLSAQFSTNLSQFDVPSSSELNLNIRFTPNSTDQISSLILVFHNLPTSPDTIIVSGMGLKVPIIQLSQRNISFGNVLIRRSKDSVISVTNLGTQILQISNAISSHVAFTIRPSSLMVGAGQLASDTISFSPTTAGPVSGLVLFFSTSPSSPDTIKVDGVGTTSTYADDESQIPNGYYLKQNYPNPFNPNTTISYELPKASNVSLKVFTTLGQVVATLVDERKEAGYHQVQWNADVPSGIYFYRLQAGEYVETKKMIVLR